VQRQINHLKVGGCPVFVRKVLLATKKLMRLIGVFVTILLVLLIVIIRSFIRLRFGVSRSNRIGHFAADAEAYLCLHDSLIQAA